MKFITAILIALTAAAATTVAPADAYTFKSGNRGGGVGVGSSSTAVKTLAPSGSYCGSYMANMVVGKVTMNPTNPTTFDITVKAFANSESTCKAIAYNYDMASSAMTVPDASNRESCLGDLLASGGLSLHVEFEKEKNHVKLDLGIAKLSLAQC